MTLSIDDKYDLIYAHEEQFAYRLGNEVVKKPEVSVWMILIPILFLHHMQKVNQYKAGVRSFAQGILAPQKKALDKAYKEASAGEKIHYDLKDYFSESDITAEKQQRTLAEKQVRVIRVMEEHYLAMLTVSAETFADLLKRAYLNRGEYRRYLNRLEKAEKELYEYLKNEVHTTEASREVIKQIEKSCERLRAEEMRRLF
ncbi:MAG: NF038143 family protein [Desulfosalsimonadaceae bacterium]